MLTQRFISLGVYRTFRIPSVSNGIVVCKGKLNFSICNRSEHRSGSENEEAMRIVQGEEIIERMTRYFSDISVKNPKTPFKILVLDGREIQENEMLEHLSADKISAPSKQKLDAFWEKFMSHHGFSEATKDTLILAGQPGMLLAMVFQQVMCEAFTLAESFKNLPLYEQQLYFYVLRNVYHENIRFINKQRTIVKYPTPTMCFSEQIFLLIDPVSRKTVNNIAGALRTRGKSFILNDCFNKEMQLLIQHYLQDIRASKSTCSELLIRDLHFSFDFIDSAGGNMNDKVEIMENLIQSARRYRTKLSVILRNYKGGSTSYFSPKITQPDALQQSPDEQLQDKTELPKSSIDIPTKGDIQKNKKEMSSFPTINLSASTKKKINTNVSEKPKKNQDDTRTATFYVNLDSDTENDVTSFDPSRNPSASTSNSDNSVSENVPNKGTEASPSSDNTKAKGVFQRIRRYIGRTNKPTEDEGLLDSYTKHPHKPTFYYDLNSINSDNSDDSSGERIIGKREDAETTEMLDKEKKKTTFPISSHVQNIPNVSPHHEALMNELKQYNMKKSKTLSG